MAYSVWCSLERADEARFHRVISDLARAQGGAVFPPHMTLGSFHEPPDLNALAAGIPAFTLQPIDLARSDAFTLSLFVRLGRSAPVTDLRARIEAHDGFRLGRTFAPHISLCYGVPPTGSEDRDEIAELLSGPVRFDRLTLAELTLPITGYADIEGLRVVSDCALG